jgi:hypothetical protein
VIRAEVLIERAFTLAAVLRSVQIGQVVLLVAALVLPFAEVSDLLEVVFHSRIVTVQDGESVFEAADVSDAGLSSTDPTVSELLYVPHLDPAPELPSPLERAGLVERPTAGAVKRGAVRRDVERGPPVLL